MTSIQAPSGVKQITVERTITRADGTVEPQPLIYWHKNPLRRIWHRLTYRSK